MTLTFGSLFAGIGGFDLGFERAGMRCAWQVEIDDFCQQVLAKHWPDVPRLGDVRNVGRHNLAPVDIICGGFPCQPHSVAGKRQGAQDDRDLWPEYRRIVDELRPTWVVAENVPGIRTTILDQVLSDLGNLGYSAETISLPAAAFDAWHPRQRYFIVAHTASKRTRSVPVRPGRQDKAAIDVDGQGASVSPDIEGAGLANWRQTGTSTAANETNERMAQPRPERCDSTWWPSEPGVGRVVYGVSSRLDKIERRKRISGLGNAVVPQVAEFIGRLIVEIESIQ